MVMDFDCGECFEAESTHTDETDHDFELGCYCGERGKCGVCLDKAIDYADHLRDVAKEDGIDWRSE